MLIRAARTIAVLAFSILAASALAGEWSVLESPSPGDQNVFHGVAGVTHDDIWAVGMFRPLPGEGSPWFTHFDGSSWQEISLDALDGLGTSRQLDDVVLLPDGGVLLVGNAVLGLWHGAPMVAVYSDGEFTEAAVIELSPQVEYPYGPRSGAPLDAVAFASGDIWIVGSAAGHGSGAPGGSQVAMALHTDGTSWMEVAVPGVGGDVDFLRAVDGVAPDDIWGVGDGRWISGPQRAWVLHWDGAAWSHVPSPPQDDELMMSQLFDVVAIAADDVWAAGSYSDPTSGDQGALFLHWDGANWTEHRVPTSPFSGARGIAALAADDIWAAGGGGQNVYFHFDGAGWSEVAGAPELDGLSIGRTDQALLAFADGGLASFGTINGEGFASEVLVERYMPATPTMVGGTPAALATLAAYPNPFNPMTNIRCDLARPGRVRADVFDARGRLLRRLLDETRAAGVIEVAWDGRDDGGRVLASGLYLVKFQMGESHLTTSLSLIR